MRRLCEHSDYCVVLPFCTSFQQGTNKGLQQGHDFLLWQARLQAFSCTLLGERKIAWAHLKWPRCRDSSALRTDSELLQRKYLQLYVKQLQTQKFPALLQVLLSACSVAMIISVYLCWLLKWFVLVALILADLPVLTSQFSEAHLCFKTKARHIKLTTTSPKGYSCWTA